MWITLVKPFLGYPVEEIITKKSKPGLEQKSKT
jgi:hypothetical protein